MVPNTIETKDLILRLPEVDFAQSLTEFYIRNRFFLQEFEGMRDALFFRNTYQADTLKDEIQMAHCGSAYRFYLFQKSKPQDIIGLVGLNDIMWGCCCSSFIGYKMDEVWQGRGYMTQAIEAAVQVAFEGLHLHRIEGNVMPRNAPSLRVLEKCGFYPEGIAKKYLYINGRWEDHIHMVKLNDDNCGRG